MNLRAGQLGQVFGRELRVSGRRGHRRADRGGAEIDLVQELADFDDPLHFFADRRTPAVELLAERHRHRVLQVRAAHLEHPIELLAPWRRRPAAAGSSASM